MAISELALTLRSEAFDREAAADPATVIDLRFRGLIGEAAWSRLSPTIRSRFGQRLAPQCAVTYAGTVIESWRSPAGGWLANACRLIGAPLPLHDDIAAPAVVTVTEDAVTRGQFWTRIYGSRRGFPQVIHSRKGFGGPTGLEEYLGWGFGIALTVKAEAKALHFCSHHYFVKLGRQRLRLPSWLSPGELVVSHIDQEGGAFLFVLILRHERLGQLIRQSCVFRERFIRPT